MPIALIVNPSKEGSIIDNESPVVNVYVIVSFPLFLNWSIADVFDITFRTLTFSSFFDKGSKCSFSIPLIKLRLKESQAFNSYTRLLKSFIATLFFPLPTVKLGNVAP